MSHPLRLEVESSRGRQTISVSHSQLKARLSEVLRRQHLPLNTRCGQRSLCDGCIVELIAGNLVRVSTGETVNGNGQPQSLRGCEFRLGDCEAVQIRIPPRSLLAYEPQVVSNFKLKVPRAHDPLWQQIEIPRAEIPDGKLSADNLCHAIATRSKRRRPVRIEPRVADGLTDIAHDGKLLVTTEYREDHWLITDVANDTQPKALGAAIDIGTTTVAVLVVDMADGHVVGTAANFNRQMHLGDDVLTRINLCSTDPAMLGHLQELVVKDTIAPLLAEALTQAGASAAQLHCITIAANTTMLHLFAGIDPTSMGIAPFTPVFIEHRTLSASVPAFASLTPIPPTLGIGAPTIHLLPGASAYVGADLTAGAFATGLVYDDGPNLLVDVGTNGEIILKKGEHLYGCATAAGPAFEGAGLSHGVRATEGAIAHMQLTKEPFTLKTEVIGRKTPIGLCGTAYIDFLAQARRIGLITAAGRFDKDAVPSAADHLIQWEDYGLALRIAYGQGKRDIVITELDIARLLQAKAAVAAGILTLLERIGLTPREVKRLYLAGGFGLHLNPAFTIGCGLLPGFTPDQIEIVGNTSLAGAYLALLDCGALDEIARAGKKMEVIELNLDPGFESRYIDQLSLPA
jgi:uncharacterized 2Fe-2S/4Fe-4S cluster protein (DUF4445 family)